MTVENFRQKKLTRAQREGIAPGLPESLSWDDTPWEYDDHAAELVAEGFDMTLLEVGDKMGISRERVRQLEVSVEKKLGQLSQFGFDIDKAEAETLWAFREIFNRFDRDRLIKRLAFAKRLLDDDELVEHLQDVVGDQMNAEDVDFSKLAVVAEIFDRHTGLHLVSNHDCD